MNEAVTRDQVDQPSRPEDGSPPPYQVVVMDRSCKAAYLLLPQLLEAVRKFEFKYGDKTRAQRMADMVEASFCSEEPWMPAAVVLGDGGRIVGHGVASIESVVGTRYLYVAQIHKLSHVPTKWMLQLMEACIGWARVHGIERLLAYPRAEALEKIFIEYGMKPVARTLTLDLRAVDFGGENG